MERNVDEEFQILADHLAEKKKFPVDSDSEDDEEEQREHEGVETEEDFVCCKCGLVLSSIFQPDTGTSICCFGSAIHRLGSPRSCSQELDEILGVRELTQIFTVGRHKRAIARDENLKRP